MDISALMPTSRYLFAAFEKQARFQRDAVVGRLELFNKQFSILLAFVYHCFDRMVGNGRLNGLSRPERGMHFSREVVGAGAITKEVLRQRTTDYQNWVEAFARNHQFTIEWAAKGLRKEDLVRPWLRRMKRNGSDDIYFIFESMEQGAASVPLSPGNLTLPGRSRRSYLLWFQSVSWPVLANSDSSGLGPGPLSNILFQWLKYHTQGNLFLARGQQEGKLR